MRYYRSEDNDGGHIFVFGSNLRGFHGMGAAKDAARFWGATFYIGNGRTGQAYAIPTKDEHFKVLPVLRIKKFVDQFLEYARRNPDLIFLVTQIGCGLAGYHPSAIAPLFRKAPKNCQLPEEFIRIIKEQHDTRTRVPSRTYQPTNHRTDQS